MGCGQALGRICRNGALFAASRIISAALGVFLLVGSVQALSISLNPVNRSGSGMSSTADDALGGSQLVGVPAYAATAISWNNILQNSSGTPRQLRDSANPSAYDSGVWAMWRSAGVVGLTPTYPGGTSNYKMMWGAMVSTDETNDAPPPIDFFDRSANQPLIYVRGLSAWLNKSGQPAGTNSYAVLIYVDGDGTNRNSEYWLQRVPANCPEPPTELGPDLASHVFVHEDGADFSGSFTRVAASADSEAGAANGNYILWQGLTADRFIVRTEAHGSSDGCRRAVINGVQIVAEANPAPAITVAATHAAEPSTNGTFTLTRTGETNASLTVYYAVGGTATPGIDYYAEDLPGSVTIPIGSSSATITVRPKADNVIEGTETVILVPVARGQYRDGTPDGAGASVNLADARPPVRLDADRDGDIDQADFAVFQRCFTGTSQLATTVACLEMDVNGDQFVNETDFEEFARCMSGPGVTVRADCSGN